jgi:hypothetical protein
MRAEGPDKGLEREGASGLLFLGRHVLQTHGVQAIPLVCNDYSLTAAIYPGVFSST